MNDEKTVVVNRDVLDALLDNAIGYETNGRFHTCCVCDSYWPDTSDLPFPEENHSDDCGFVRLREKLK